MWCTIAPTKAIETFKDYPDDFKIFTTEYFGHMQELHNMDRPKLSRCNVKHFLNSDLKRWSSMIVRVSVTPRIHLL